MEIRGVVIWGERGDDMLLINTSLQEAKGDFLKFGQTKN